MSLSCCHVGQELQVSTAINADNDDADDVYLATVVTVKPDFKNLGNEKKKFWKKTLKFFLRIGIYLLMRTALE